MEPASRQRRLAAITPPISMTTRRPGSAAAVRSNRSIDYQDVPRPVAALVDEYPSGHFEPRHSHRRAQMLYATAGVAVVTTDNASYVLPPQRALWLPSGVGHEVACRSQLSVRTLYIDEKVRTDLPDTCHVFEVSDLLRELILAACRMPIEYDEQGRDGRVMRLILDEIASAPGIPLQVPMPRDPRLLRVCQAILEDPAHAYTLDDWSRMAGMGRRTFTRLFRREAHVSFAMWRQHVRLMEAMARLAVGEPVTSVALDVGYNSPSAFTAMFRKAFGATPTHYINGRHLELYRQEPRF